MTWNKSESEINRAAFQHNKIWRAQTLSSKHPVQKSLQHAVHKMEARDGSS